MAGSRQRARLADYSTTIPVDTTAHECLGLLGAAGADEAALRYSSGEPVGMTFTLETPHGRRKFLLPVDIEGAHKALRAMLAADPPHVSRSQLDKLGSSAHAARVAWRVARDWLRAVLALIQMGQADLTEEMLGRLEVEPGKRLYVHYREQESSALEAGRA